MRRALIAAASLLVALPLAPASGSHGATEGMAVVGLVAPESAAPGAPRRSEVERRYPWRIPRALQDRPDGGGALVHVVYLATTDQAAPPLDRFGLLEDSVRSQDAWMQETAGLRWRLDVFRFRSPARHRSIRAIDVTYVHAGLPSEEVDDLAEIRSLLAARGLDEPGKRYLVYAAVDAGPVCGEGEYPLSDDPDQVGVYAAVYLYSDDGCGAFSLAADRHSPSWAEAIAQQELMHNDGAVPPMAPRDCRPLAPGHVCTPGLVATALDPEMGDVMFPYASGPLAEKALDLGRNDYFRHDLPYRDLADSPHLAPVETRP